MAYATTANVELAVGGAARLLQLSDDDRDGIADAGLIDSAIAEADGLINSYASKRYHVPLTTPTVDIVALSARHAARVLRRYKNQVLASDITDEKNDRDWLKALSLGQVNLASDPQPPESAIVLDKAQPRESTKNVSRERLKGYW